MLPANEPPPAPRPPASTVPRPITGPPVSSNSAANSLNVKVSFLSDFDLKTPSVSSTSFASVSQMAAARSSIWFFTSTAASCAAQPVAYVTRLPPVTSVFPIESVSTTVGWTSCAPIPRTSAACIETAVRLPPMSVDPSTKFKVPSLLTAILTDDLKPTLNQ